MYIRVKKYSSIHKLLLNHSHTQRIFKSLSSQNCCNQFTCSLAMIENKGENKREKARNWNCALLVQFGTLIDAKLVNCFRFYPLPSTLYTRVGLHEAGLEQHNSPFVYFGIELLLVHTSRLALRQASRNSCFWSIQLTQLHNWPIWNLFIIVPVPSGLNPTDTCNECTPVLFLKSSNYSTLCFNHRSSPSLI